MLKWLRTIDWVPILASAIFLSLALWAISSLYPYVAQSADYQPQNNSDWDGIWRHIWTALNYSGTWVAVSTIVIAIFTYFLSRGAKRQIDLQGRQIALQEQQHFLTHRPHLIVRNVRAVEPHGVGDQIKISFDVVNAGTSEALITASNFEIRKPVDSYSEDPPTEVGNPAKNFLGTSILAINAKWPDILPTGSVWTADHFHDQGVPQRGVFFMGKIVYRERNGEGRRIGVLRRLDVPSRRFLPLPGPDPDYEYDD